MIFVWAHRQSMCVFVSSLKIDRYESSCTFSIGSVWREPQCIIRSCFFPSSCLFGFAIAQAKKKENGMKLERSEVITWQIKSTLWGMRHVRDRSRLSLSVYGNAGLDRWMLMCGGSWPQTTHTYTRAYETHVADVGDEKWHLCIIIMMGIFADNNFSSSIFSRSFRFLSLFLSIFHSNVVVLSAIR